MEESGHASFRAANNFIKNADTFKLDLMKRLKWSKKDWGEAGQVDTRVHKLCNSLHYWKRKLKPAVESNSIVITLFNERNNVQVGLLDIIDIVESLDEKFVVTGVANFRNPRYICLYFCDEEVRDRVVQQFRMMEESYVVYLSWALNQEPSTSSLTVHWLPITVNTELIKKQLDKYVEFIEEERKNLFFMNGRKMPSAKIEFKIKYKKDVTPEMIPHTTEINDMEALITIGGRKPLCLSCDRLGHISKDCDYRFCAICRVLKSKKHECVAPSDVKSYAEMVKSAKHNDPLIDPDAYEKNTVIDKKSSLREKKVIEAKISKIESLLKNSNTVLNEENTFVNEVANEEDLTNEEKGEQEVGSCSEYGDGDSEDSESSMEGLVEEGGEGYHTSSANKQGLFAGAGSSSSKIVNAKQEAAGVSNSKKRKKTNKGRINRDINDSVLKVNKDPIPLNMVTRSYGKPNLDNPRRLREEARFQKILNKQEFVFKD